MWPWISFRKWPSRLPSYIAWPCTGSLSLLLSLSSYHADCTWRFNILMWRSLCLRGALSDSTHHPSMVYSPYCCRKHEYYIQIHGLINCRIHDTHTHYASICSVLWRRAYDAYKINVKETYQYTSELVVYERFCSNDCRKYIWLAHIIMLHGCIKYSSINQFDMILAKIQTKIRSIWYILFNFI